MNETNSPHFTETGPVREASSPDLFDPERTFTTDNFDHAREACHEDFNYRRIEIALDRFVLDEEFRANVEGEQYGLTEKAFDDVCTVLDVPARFARHVPRDLLTIIVDRLADLHQQTVVAVARDDVIVGMVDPARWSGARKTSRPHYLPVSNGELLSLTEKVWGARGDRPHITISDIGLSVEVVDPTITVEPSVGDIIRVGAAVTGSETGGPAPSARGYTLRLVCANGATVPTSFGTVHFSTDWRVGHERRVEAFTNAIHGFSLDMARIQRAYDGIAEGELTDHQVWTLHRQAAYVFRCQPHAELQADRVLGVDEDTRKRLVAAVRERQSLLRRGNSSAALPSGLRAWDVYNTVTANARDGGSYRRRVALEALGGDLLQAFAPPAAS